MKSFRNDYENSELPIYTDINEAKKEIWRRWNDNVLRQEVELFLRDVPSALRREPKAVLFRHLMTPNYECIRFFDLAHALQLNPLGWEYLEDIFLTINKDKAYLGKMGFINHPRNGNCVRYSRVIKMNENEKRKFTEIRTLWGESFVDFHHRLLAKRITGLQLFDASLWYASKGGKAKEYYQYFIALFICHGILFDNFIAYGREGEFTRIVVQPSIERITKLFGLKPLIVQLVLDDSMNERHYPEDMANDVLRCLPKNKIDNSSAPHMRGSIR